MAITENENELRPHFSAGNKPTRDDFHLLFANNPHPMWVYDLETLAFLEVNAVAVLRYGYTREEFLSMRITDIRPEEDVERLLSAVEVNEARDPILLSRPWRHRYKNGEIIDVEITSHILAFEGRPAVLVTAQNVTERRLAEASLVASEARFRAIFENSLDGIGIAYEGKHVYTNPAYHHLFGYSEEELFGNSIAMVLTPAEGIAVEERARRRVRGDSDVPSLYESVGRRRDGSEVQIEIRASTYQQNNEIFNIAIIRDISERKQREAENLAAYEREKRIAQTLQKTLLLSGLQSCPGVEVEAFYQADVRDGALVGGDFFDAFPLSKGKVALVVGDASGKGLAAAARTAEVKYVLRAFLRDGSEPAVALTRLNKHLCDPDSTLEQDRTTFIALALVVLDTKAATGTFAQAGAEPTLILRGGGQNEDSAVAEAMGLPLGIEPDTEYGQVVFKLDRSDLLILTTDGITEARHPSANVGESTFLGQEGVVALARNRQKGKTLRQVGQAILEGATVFADGLLRDDVCFLLARLK